MAPEDRLPPIPPDQQSPDQKKAAEDFKAYRKQEVFGPFVPLLRSPEVMLRVMALGDYLRYRTVLAPRLNEFVILITARQWSQPFEWHVHHPIALKEGLDPAVASAVADGRRPTGLQPDEDIAYDFCTELFRNQSVSDTTYARALEQFGEQGTVEMLSVAAYYSFQSMILNTARTALPAGHPPGLSPFPK